MQLRGAGAVVVSGALGVVCVLLLDSALFGHTWAEAWRMLGVPGLLPPFADMHTVTDSAGCAQQGIDVYTDARCDPFRRVYNYPPAWLLLGRLGIDGGATLWLGTLSGIGFVLSLLWLLRGLPVAAGIMTALTLTSPSVLLCVERGNVDLLIFILLVGFCASMAKPGWRGALLAATTLGVGIILKLYPIFAIGVAARLDRRSAAIAGSGALIFLIYMLALGDTADAILSNTQQSLLGSFGAHLFFDAVGLPFTSEVTAIVLLAAAAASLRLGRSGSSALQLLEGFHGFAFLVGASLYCGLFLFLPSWVYRLIVLVLCIPQLHDWITGEHAHTTKAVGWTAFGAMLMMLWQPTFSGFLLTPHIAAWVLLAIFSTILFLAALRGGLRRSLARRVAAN